MRSKSTSAMTNPRVEIYCGRLMRRSRSTNRGSDAQWIPGRFTSQVGQPIEALLVGLFEPVQRLIVFTKTDMNDCERHRRRVSLLRRIGELSQNLPRFVALAKAGTHVAEIGCRDRATSGQCHRLLDFCQGVAVHPFGRERHSQDVMCRGEGGIEIDRSAGFVDTFVEMPGQDPLHREGMAEGGRHRIAVQGAARDAHGFLEPAGNREIEGVVPSDSTPPHD